MFSFGTCNGNREGFTVNNLGILVVVFIPKRTRLELPFICCGGHFTKQMYSICMFFQDYYYARRRKMCQALLSSPATSNCLEATGRENTRLGQSGWLLAIVQMEIFSQGSLFLHFLSSFIIIRIAVSFFVKKIPYEVACTTANRSLFLILIKIFLMFRYALQDV